MARPFAAEAQPDGSAATALDRPKLMDHMLACWPGRCPEPGAARANGRTAAVLVPSQRPDARTWIAVSVVCVVSGVAGAILGAWLASML